MKIIAGTWRGALLKHPPVSLSRPTQERVKKSIFDILTPTLSGSRVLDLFSGCGSLGIEALSRGAKEVTFVEWNSLCMKLLKENLVKLKGRKQVFYLEENALKAIGKLSKRDQKFDVIFLDPPYLEGVTTKCLRIIGKCDILSATVILVVRHADRDKMPVHSGPLRLWRQKRYGQARVSFYQMKP